MSFQTTGSLSLPTVTRVLIAAWTVLFTTCTDILTFTALWAQDFMCLSSHFQQQVIYNICVNFNMSSHLAVPVSCLPLAVISHSSFATLCCRTRLWVHLRRWGRSNVATTYWLWYLKKGIFSVGYCNFTAWIKSSNLKQNQRFLSSLHSLWHRRQSCIFFPPTSSLFESGFIWVSYLLSKVPVTGHTATVHSKNGKCSLGPKTHWT